ncbi:MAG: ABC transporter permease subunit [Actinobacteria bacterium]|nr:ABC transporter permease subunit [Actinomycetota bacterium]
MSAIPTLIGYALREAVRRKVFVVVVLLTILFLALYWLGATKAFEEARSFSGATDSGVDVETLTGATLFGLSMFATLFLGTVLGVFLTLGSVRGDAERGLLQPLVVRPVGRVAFLVARFLGAAAVSGLYAIAVFAGALAITVAAGPWRPDSVVAPALELAAGVGIVTAISLLGSVFLSATANGIAIFMVFGAGLVSGLLGQIGEALDSPTLVSVARATSWLLPFEALYQDGLHRITEDTRGFTEIALQLGPFGGAQAGGSSLLAWSLAYLALVLGIAALAFGRSDL